MALNSEFNFADWQSQFRPWQHVHNTDGSVIVCKNYNYSDALGDSNRKLFSETETPNQMYSIEPRCISSATIKRPVTASGLHNKSRNLNSMSKTIEIIVISRIILCNLNKHLNHKLQSTYSNSITWGF